MVDTFMLKYRLDRQQRENVYGAVNRLVREAGSTQYLYPDKAQDRKLSGRYKTAAFYPMGILEVAVRDCRYPGNYGSAVTLKCKPALVLHSDDAYSLSANNDYNAAIALVNNFIMELNVYMEACPLPLLEGWDVERMDYAFQFPTEEYDLYLKFLRKGCSFKEDKFEDSVYIENTKCTVNFYDKTVQLGLEDNRHMIRFEVQCHADYLYKMLYDERIGSLKLRELWDDRLALSIVTKRIGKLIGYGDFYSIKEAESVLQKDGRTDKNEKACVMQLLKSSLHPSARRGSQWDLFVILTAVPDNGDKLRKQMEHILKRLDMNQMAIPVRRRVSRLINPVHVIRDILQGNA